MLNQGDQVAYRKIDDFGVYKSPIIGVVHTNEFIYVFTKKRELFGYPRNIFKAGSSQNEHKTMSNIVNANIQKVGCITSNSNYHLLVLANGVISIAKENRVQQFQPVQYDADPGPILNFITISNNALLVALTSSSLSIFKYTDVKFVTKAKIQFNRKVIDMIGSLTKVLIYDKSSYSIFDVDLREIDKENHQNRFKMFHSIEGTNGFIGLTYDSKLVSIGETVMNAENIVFNEDLVGLKIRIPYVYGITQKKIIIKTIVGSIEESLLHKTKAPMVDVLDDYNVVIASGKNMQLMKFNMSSSYPYIPHIIKFKSLMRESKENDSSSYWEYIIELCKKFDSNSFDNKATLCDIYAEYSESLLLSGQFAKAFKIFQLSGKHPFVILHNFRYLLYTDYDFKELAKKDCETYIELLKKTDAEIDKALNLRDKTTRSSQRDFDDQIEEVVKCRTDCIIQSGLKINPPTIQQAKDRLDELKKWCTNSIENSQKTLKYISEYLFSDRKSKFSSGNEGVSDLKDYIIDILLFEHQPTCIKIYNTLLAECYAINMVTNLDKFIKEDNPLFFEVAAAALKKNAPEDFRKLCRLYNRHDAALEPLFDSFESSWQIIINYIKESQNFIELGEQYFYRVYSRLEDMQNQNKKFSQSYNSKGEEKARDNKAIEMFHSKYLDNPNIAKSQKADNVERVLKVIQESVQKKNQNEKEQLINLQINFLEFAIYKCNITNDSVHWKLINLYLSLIAPSAKYYTKCVKISTERQPIRKYREGLVNILEKSESYKTQETLDAIINVSEKLMEERITVMKKAIPPQIKEAIDLVSKPNVPFDIAIEFCDSIYERSQKNTYSDIPNENYYNMLFEAYYNQKQEANAQVHNNDLEIDKYIINLLNDKADKMELEKIIDRIPEYIRIMDMNNFLTKSTTNTINNLRLLKLKNSLLSKTIEIKEKQLAELKRGKVVVTNNLRCIICGKKIGDSVFFALGNNTVAHIGCRMQSD